MHSVANEERSKIKVYSGDIKLEREGKEGKTEYELPRPFQFEFERGRRGQNTTTPIQFSYFAVALLFVPHLIHFLI